MWDGEGKRVTSTGRLLVSRALLASWPGIQARSRQLQIQLPQPHAARERRMQNTRAAQSGQLAVLVRARPAHLVGRLYIGDKTEAEGGTHAGLMRAAYLGLCNDVACRHDRDEPIGDGARQDGIIAVREDLRARRCVYR
jgi:hypothetical protein